MSLLTDDELERLAIVANCRMNRERNLLGSNGYDRELGFDPVSYLRARASLGRSVTWLDLCCGSGKALIQAAQVVQADQLPVQILGVDLVGMFRRIETSQARCLRLVEASVRHWRPDHPFDLITCIHGLHYVGDKIGLIALAASWLVEDGLFVANLDLNNLKIDGSRSKARHIAHAFRLAGLFHDSRHHLVRCQGRRTIKLPYSYLGADGNAGPNYTRQPAVNSHYEELVL